MSIIQYIKTVIIVSIATIVISFALAYAMDKNVKCHGCKDKDLNLISRHKLVGYEGCLKCHYIDGQLKDDKKEKEAEPKKEK